MRTVTFVSDFRTLKFKGYGKKRKPNIRRN